MGNGLAVGGVSAKPRAGVPPNAENRPASETPSTVLAAIAPSTHYSMTPSAFLELRTPL